MDQEKNNNNQEKISEKELIGGRIYNRAPIKPEIQQIAEIFQVVAQKYKLTNKPLDIIYKPFESISLKNNSNTIIRPMLAIKTNKSDNEVDWVVDYIENDDDELALCIKPLIFRDFGVSEYWIIDQKKKQLIIYDFKRNGFKQEVIGNPRRIKVGIYDSLILNYSDFF